MAVTTSTTLSNTYQKYFSKKLLDHAVDELRLNEFALEAELPKNAGSKIITFFRKAAADASNVVTLSEGTPISTFRDVTLTPIDVTLAQIGEAAKITDIVTMTGLFDALKQSIDTMGEDCALDADTRTRNVLCHASTGLGKRYAQGLASFASLAASSVANAKLTGADILDAATSLKNSKAPRINGGFVAILPPSVSRDVMRDSDWLDAAKYSDVRKLYKGEIGTIWGVRCVEATNPFIEAGTEGTYNAGGAILTTIVTGRGAYGVPKLAGTQSPWTPKVIINDKPDKSDPLNQFITAGWKAYWAAAVLNAAFGRALRSKTAFVA
jgi:N4-gp56 family major capsid protein